MQRTIIEVLCWKLFVRWTYNILKSDQRSTIFCLPSSLKCLGSIYTYPSNPKIQRVCSGIVVSWDGPASNAMCRHLVGDPPWVKWGLSRFSPARLMVPEKRKSLHAFERKSTILWMPFLVRIKNPSHSEISFKVV